MSADVSPERLDALDCAARLLADAYLHRQALSGPDALGNDAPTTLAEGYWTQRRMRELAGIEPAAWKVGATSAAAQQILGVDAPFLGRPGADRILPSGAAIDTSAWCTGLQALEVEVGVRPRIDLTELPADPLDLASEVDIVPCIEVVDFRVGAITGVPGPCLVADNGVTLGLVLGEPLALDAAGIRSFDQAEVELTMTGIDPLPEPVRGVASMALGHPLRALHVAAGIAIELGTPIGAGEVVSTGTCTGIQPGRPGLRATAAVGGGRVALAFE